MTIPFTRKLAPILFPILAILAAPHAAAEQTALDALQRIAHKDTAVLVHVDLAKGADSTLVKASKDFAKTADKNNGAPFDIRAVTAYALALAPAPGHKELDAMRAKIDAGVVGDDFDWDEYERLEVQYGQSTTTAIIKVNRMPDLSKLGEKIEFGECEAYDAWGTLFVIVDKHTLLMTAAHRAETQITALKKKAAPASIPIAAALTEMGDHLVTVVARPDPRLIDDMFPGDGPPFVQTIRSAKQFSLTVDATTETVLKANGQFERKEDAQAMLNLVASGVGMMKMHPELADEAYAPIRDILGSVKMDLDDTQVNLSLSITDKQMAALKVAMDELLNRARQTAMRVQWLTQARAVYVSAVIYAAQQKDDTMLPPDLYVLLKQPDALDPILLLHPSSTSALSTYDGDDEKKDRAWIDKHSSLVYLGGENDTSATKIGIHGNYELAMDGKIPVVWRDGHATMEDVAKVKRWVDLQFQGKPIQE